jgi:predicted dehydrogenase
MSIEKVLIVGHGSTGIRHATNIVTDLDPSLQIGFLRRIESPEFRFAQYFYSCNEAKSWNPDVTIICSPSNTHAEYISTFSNSHIFVEKPALTNEKDLYSLNSLRTDRVFQIGFNLRYHDLIKTIDRSDVKEVEWRHSDFLPSWHSWEDYRNTYAAHDGVALTLCHGLDLIYQLFGSFKVISRKKQYILDIPADSSFFAELDCSGIPVKYSSIMDSEDKECTLKVTHKNGQQKIYDFNSVEFPRNESFRREIINFFSRIENSDTTNNESEYNLASLILDTCEQ